MPAAAGPVRSVVFHADDFGMNAAVDQGILTAFREGLLTSTSVLANAPSAESACLEWPALVADQAASRLASAEIRQETNDLATSFDLGIHLNLTQGQPLTGARFPAELLDQTGNFPGIGAIFTRLRRAHFEQLAAVKNELQTQIEWLCDRGLKPTHLNGHQYVELIPPVAAMIPELLRRYSIPVVRVARESGLIRSVLLQGRVVDWGVGLVKRYYAGRFRRRLKTCDVAFPERFFGTSHAGRINMQTVQQFLRLAARGSFIEIGVHPGIQSQRDDSPHDNPWFDPLSHLRPHELKWLCSAQLRDLLIRQQWKLSRLQSLNAASHR